MDSRRNSYQFWHEQTSTDFSDENITSLYNQGYVFTRLGKGILHQVRSVRVDLSKFSPSSENRRVLKKLSDVELTVVPLPLATYHWRIGKMAHDFYVGKFGEGVMSANKIKELCTNKSQSTMNELFVYTHPASREPVGYCLCYTSSTFIHYAYPFYDRACFQKKIPIPFGIGMMTRAVLYAEAQGKHYIYLGSLHSPESQYKFQFKGTEWFDGTAWSTDDDRRNALFT